MGKEEEKEQKEREETENIRLQKIQEEEKKRKVEEEKRVKFEEKQLKLQNDMDKKEALQREKLLKENEMKELRNKENEEKIRNKEKKQEEKRKLKLLEQEKKRIKEKEKQDEKERKALAKIEKEKQAKELKAHLEAEKIKKATPELEIPSEEVSAPSLVLSRPVDIKVSEISAVSKEPSPAGNQTADRESERKPAKAAWPVTPDMSLSTRTPGQEDGKYVSVVTNDDFAVFRQNGHGEEYDEEDIDFTPQNGYESPEEIKMEFEDGKKIVRNPSKASRKSKPALSSKIASAGNKIKKARLPTAGELKEKYLNSAFHKSLNQPLMVKVRTEKQERRSQRRRIPHNWPISNLWVISRFQMSLAQELKAKKKQKPKNR